MQKAPTGHALEPRFAPTASGRRKSEKIPWDHPTSVYTASRHTAARGPDSRERHLPRINKTNRKAKPNDFPFSVAFEISDKKAMEKGQGMRR
jgi:hypothetical protein